MTNRREFLQAATALSAVPLVNRVAFAIGGTAVALDTVIFDSRHPQSCDFADRASRLGVTPHAIEADITDLWQSILLKRWQTGPAAIAGLTERPALFLLERLAWEHGQRVVFEAEHAADGAVHRVIRSGQTGLARELATAGRNWPRMLVDVMIAGSDTVTRDYRPTDAAMAAGPGEPVKLYSWIIAPRDAA